MTNTKQEVNRFDLPALRSYAKFYALGYHDAKTGQEQTFEDCWEANAYGEGYTDALKEEAGR